MRRVFLLLVVGFALIQFVPYGWTKSNPPVTNLAQWPDETTAELARGACYDCHSNETRWPLYSYVAPQSWLVRMDVERGRDELNFSEFDAGDADKAADEIEDGAMPRGATRCCIPTPGCRLRKRLS